MCQIRKEREQVKEHNAKKWAKSKVSVLNIIRFIIRFREAPLTLRTGVLSGTVLASATLFLVRRGSNGGNQNKKKIKPAKSPRAWIQNEFRIERFGMKRGSIEFAGSPTRHFSGKVKQNKKSNTKVAWIRSNQLYARLWRKCRKRGVCLPRLIFLLTQHFQLECGIRITSLPWKQLFQTWTLYPGGELFVPTFISLLSLAVSFSFFLSFFFVDGKRAKRMLRLRGLDKNFIQGKEPRKLQLRFMCYPLGSCVISLIKRRFPSLLSLLSFIRHLFRFLLSWISDWWKPNQIMEYPTVNLRPTTSEPLK